MASLTEQRAAVKFCFLLDKNADETVLMLKTAYKDDAMGKTRVYEWFARFKNDDMSIDDKPRSGRRSTARNDENVEKIQELVLIDRRQTIDQLSEISGLSWSSMGNEFDHYTRQNEWQAPKGSNLHFKRLSKLNY
ncbi:hypothetical protein NQ318_014078 [Aromia moschata]|uniref:Mos1 transposase HTH domain-containing protein n=1 Tax=Aromia moschata TaxID=1265417 RepID=A0AAV8YX86_9CUCU|nr:hypothetical protein NQ318_014078 [Aromia moschata]